MLTKFEMEKIWNDREIGILKRNFCSHKKVKKVKNFPVNYSVTVMKMVDTKNISDVVISQIQSNVRYSSEVLAKTKALRLEFEKQYPGHVVDIEVFVGKEIK